MYTFENICIEKPEIRLGDDSTKVFLNATSKADGITPKIREFFDYLMTQKTTGELTSRIEQNVRSAASNEKWRLEYMTLEMKIREEREEAREEGREEERVRLVEQMLKDGRTPEEIHDFCHIPLDLILRVQHEQK